MLCECTIGHAPALVVLTGGPGAGKTAVLEIVKRNFCEHVQILPEAAGIVFGGGFPRKVTLPVCAAAQRAGRRVGNRGARDRRAHRTRMVEASVATHRRE